MKDDLKKNDKDYPHPFAVVLNQKGTWTVGFGRNSLSDGLQGNASFWVIPFFCEAEREQRYYARGSFAPFIDPTVLEEIRSLCLDGSGEHERWDCEVNEDWHDFETQWDFYQKKLKKNEWQKAVLIGGRTYVHRDWRCWLPWVWERVVEATKRWSHLWGYVFWDGRRGAVGVSPEYLFLKIREVVEVLAVAGTRTDGEPTPPTFKELREHRWVVDQLSQVLINYGRVHKFPMKLVPFGGLFHWVTPFELQLTHGCGDWWQKLLMDLHPTAAVGIYPKKKEALREWSFVGAQKKRGYFGSPLLVEISGKTLVTPIMIRGIFWDEETTRVWAGVGVVRDSNVREEQKELVVKLNYIEKLLMGK